MGETVVMSEETWSSISDMYSSKEDSEFLTQFMSGFPSSNDLSEIWQSDKEPICNSNEYLVSQETNLSPDDGQSVLYLDGSFLHTDYVYEGFERTGLRSRLSCFSDRETDQFEPVLYFPSVLLNSNTLGGFSDQCDVSDIGKPEKCEVDQLRQRDLPNANAPECKKRSRNSTDRCKRNPKSEKYQKITIPKNANKNDESKSSSQDSSEEHSSITQDAIKTTKVSGRERKSGKSASSDPQSLYARKRRDRINERLRILQGLVPNGTKVDISTMLEEAVHYVKFLQLQIKLLSSDETWMYAPLAYNGMDIGISNIDISANTCTR